MELFAIIGLHLLSVPVLAYALLFALDRKRIYVFFFIGLLTFHVLGLPALPAFVDEFGYDILFEGELIILISSLVMVSSVALLERLLGTAELREERRIITEATEQWPAYRMLVFACLTVVLSIAATRGWDLLELTWEEARAEAGPLDAIANLLQFLVFPAAWLAYRSDRKLTGFVLLIIALALFPVLGSRAALLTLPAVIAIDFYSREPDWRRYRTAIVVLTVIALFLHVGGRFIRGMGLGGIYQLLTAGLDAQQSIGGLLAEIDWTGGESEILRYFFFVIQQGGFADIEPLTSPLRWIMIYFPRSLFLDIKPEDVTYVLWRHAASAGIFEGYVGIGRLIELLRGGDSGSIHPFLWGEIWVNGRWAAIPAMSLMLAGILVCLDLVFMSLPSVVLALILPATAIGYIMIARGNSTIGLGYVAYLLPPVIGLYMARRAWEVVLLAIFSSRDSERLTTARES